MAGGTPPALPSAMPSIEAFLREMIERGASDLHLTTNSPPMIRLHGELVGLAHPPLSQTDTKNLTYSLLTEAQKKKFEEESELDFSFGIKGVSRFRGNLYLQKGAVGGAFRMIPHQTPQLQTLGVPPSVPELTTLPRGLVLVTGPLHPSPGVQPTDGFFDLSPPHQQSQVRAQLSLVLQGVISQQLVRRRDGRGRVLAAEVMIPNTAIRNLIREEKVHQIYSQMQVGQSKLGMQTRSHSLFALVQKNVFTPADALSHATEVA